MNNEMKRRSMVQQIGGDTGNVVPVEMVHEVLHLALQQIVGEANGVLAGPQGPQDEMAVAAATVAVKNDMGVALTPDQLVRLTQGNVNAFMRQIMPRLMRLHDCIMQAQVLMEAATAQAQARGEEPRPKGLKISVDEKAGVFMASLVGDATPTPTDTSGNPVI